MEFKIQSTDALPNYSAMSDRRWNKQGKQHIKNNYFKRQIQRFGNDWLLPNSKKSVDDIKRDIDAILRDFIRGNYTPEDIEYFFNQKFFTAVSAACWEQYNHYLFRVKQATIYYQQASIQGFGIAPEEDEIMKIDNAKKAAFEAFNVALNNFTAIMMTDHAGAVNYLGNVFQAQMASTFGPVKNVF